MAGLVRTLQPVAEPVTRDEVKAYLRVTDTGDDTLIDGLIGAARHHCEEYLGRALIDQTWVRTLDAFPTGGGISLPRPPLSSVSSIEYIDTSGAAQTWDDTQYQVVTNGYVGYLLPVYGSMYPCARTQVDAVTVTYVGGYGTNAADVPADIRHGLLILLASLYESRCGMETSITLPGAVKALWWPHRVVNV